MRACGAQNCMHKCEHMVHDAVHAAGNQLGLEGARALIPALRSLPGLVSFIINGEYVGEGSGVNMSVGMS